MLFDLLNLATKTGKLVFDGASIVLSGSTDDDNRTGQLQRDSASLIRDSDSLLNRATGGRVRIPIDVVDALQPTTKRTPEMNVFLARLAVDGKSPPPPREHFYSVHENGEGAAQYGGKPEGIAGYVYTSAAPGTKPLYRLFNATCNDHFYTTHESYEGATSKGWTYEGIACYILDSQIDGAVLFYRFIQEKTNNHFYTTHHEAEGAAGFKPEGSIGYIFTTQAPNTVPLYRWWA